MATPLLLMSSSEDRNSAQPDPNPNPNPPKGRGRKASRAHQNQKNKKPQRGMGVAQLEQLLNQQNQTHFGFPVHRGPPVRFLENPNHELPSMPNMEFQHHYSSSLFYKKKRVIGEELGFMAEKSKCGGHGGDRSSNVYDFAAFDHHHHAGFTAYTYVGGTEVLGVDKKGIGSGNNAMMEYGFFPGKSKEDMITEGNNENNIKYELETDLALKMGCSDSCSSPSPSSSSSLTTATTAYSTATCSHLDLSLKLSC